MIDVAVWLLRWTLAGVALSAIVIAAVYALEKRGRVVRLTMFRAALLAALAAPMLALVPPVFTFTAPGTYAEPDRLVPRFIEKRDAKPIAAADDGLKEEQSALAQIVSIDAVAGALFALWAAGAAFAAISHQRSYRRLSRAFRDGEPFPASIVECRLSADSPTPLLFGVLRPRMLVPADFPDWADTEREAVLCHEAAHARRGDLVWAFVGDVVRIAYWWAPPVRFLVWQHLLATEEACDSASFARDEDRHDYARALIAVARRVGGHASPGLAMTASGLRRRIERLTSHERGAISGLPVLTASAAAAFMLALSAPAAAGPYPYRIYILVSSDETSTYAVSDGERATAAVFEKCVGRLLPNAAAIIDGLEARIQDDKEDELKTIVWAPGPGQVTGLGSCVQKEPPDNDTLVLITDASEKQARRFIRQIEAHSRSPLRGLKAELGLN